MTIDTIKEKITPIAKEFGLSKVYLFGSYAKGAETDASDIDLRIEKGKLKGYIAMCSLYSALEKSLQKPIDLLTSGSLTEDFLDSIREEEIKIYDAVER